MLCMSLFKPQHVGACPPFLGKASQSRFFRKLLEVNGLDVVFCQSPGQFESDLIAARCTESGADATRAVLSDGGVQAEFERPAIWDACTN